MTLSLLRTRTVPETLEALQHDDAIILAGGQSVVVLMNLGLLHPERLVSIADVEELHGLKTGADGGFDIGALCTHAELAADARIRARLPHLATVFTQVGDARVRSNGTIGGNLAQADPAFDPPVALAALGASATLVGPDGSRSIPTEQLALGASPPALTGRELITRVHVPVPEPGTSFRYAKFRAGSASDYATVSIAVALRRTGGTVTEVSLFGGAVGPTLLDLTPAAAHLIGHHPTDPEALDRMQGTIRSLTTPVVDRRGAAAYKREMTSVIATRAIRSCASPISDASRWSP